MAREAPPKCLRLRLCPRLLAPRSRLPRRHLGQRRLLPNRRGRAVREIAALLAGTPAPDPDFAKDMGAVLDSVGTVPEDPWERS